MESSLPFPHSHNDGGSRGPYATPPAFQLVLDAPARSVAQEDVGMEDGAVDDGGAAAWSSQILPHPSQTTSLVRMVDPLFYRGDINGRGGSPVPG